ncbi:MAG: hypothetical protein COB53_07000 [Elusimicrobia bacterium]|nr:MAG: hypothetical protein COB53_07000 [Elusimicrobiota bacterium]
MPRPTRIHYPGAVYHVTARGVDKRDIFSGSADYEKMLRFMRLVRDQENAQFAAYALMPNHLHFFLRVFSTPLFKIMQRILTRYSIYFNNRYERSGHLFQGRYKAILCTDNIQFGRVIRYVHRNPLRAALESKVGEWHWTSHGDYMGISPHPITNTQFGLSFFGDDLKSARGNYLSIIGESIDGSILSNGAIVSLDEDTNSLERITKPKIDSLATIASVVAAKTSIPEKLITSRSRQRPIVFAKREFALSANQAGHSAQAIAAHLGCTLSNVSRLLDPLRGAEQQ